MALPQGVVWPRVAGQHPLLSNPCLWPYLLPLALLRGQPVQQARLHHLRGTGMGRGCASCKLEPKSPFLSYPGPQPMWAQSSPERVGAWTVAPSRHLQPPVCLGAAPSNQVTRGIGQAGKLGRVQAPVEGQRGGRTGRRVTRGHSGGTAGALRPQGHGWRLSRLECGSLKSRHTLSLQACQDRPACHPAWGAASACAPPTGLAEAIAAPGPHATSSQAWVWMPAVWREGAHAPPHRGVNVHSWTFPSASPCAGPSLGFPRQAAHGGSLPQGWQTESHCAEMKGSQAHPPTAHRAQGPQACPAPVVPLTLVHQHHFPALLSSEPTAQ